MPNIWAVFGLSGDVDMFTFCVAAECNIPFMGYKESIFKRSVVLKWFETV